MAGGTLVVSNDICLHPFYQGELEGMGFTDVSVTATKKDGLNFVINDTKPRLVIMGSSFYSIGTPYMIGELHKLFPKLNIAAVSFHGFPLSIAPWFIWYGAKSYVNLLEGHSEFLQGMRMVREGRQYVSPMVQACIDHCPEWPDTSDNLTKRKMECLVMLCCGFTPERIGEELDLSRQTINNHLVSLYKVFHVRSREEMVAVAWELELVTPDDMRFYDKKPEDRPLPKWAEVKRKCNQYQRTINNANEK